MRVSFVRRKDKAWIKAKIEPQRDELAISIHYFECSFKYDDLIKKEHKHWVYDHGFQFDEYKHLETYKYAPGKENIYIENII